MHSPAASASDIPGVMATMTDDATWLIPGKPDASPTAGLYTKEKISGLFHTMFGRLKSGLKEAERSRSQFVTLIEHGVRGRNVKYRPYAFTEQGVAMLSSVLRSKRAAQVNVEIMRAFVRLRDLVGHSRVPTKRLNDLEAKYDHQFKAVFDAIRELMTPPPSPRRRIGFVQDD